MPPRLAVGQVWATPDHHYREIVRSNATPTTAWRVPRAAVAYTDGRKRVVAVSRQAFNAWIKTSNATLMDTGAAK